MDLGDAARVKVLSPTRQVMKRFFRNRLAMFGLITLIVMFVFCFLGPLFYPHGQKEVFEKHAEQSIYYAHATLRTDSYTGYPVDDSVEMDSNVMRNVTSFIAEMKKDGADYKATLGEDGKAYSLNLLGENIYTLSQYDATTFATAGSVSVHIAQYDSMGSTITYLMDSPEEGFEAAVRENVKGREGEFEFNGMTYSFVQGQRKVYDIYSVGSDGFTYYGAAMSADFEAAVTELMGATSILDFDGQQYLLNAVSEEAFEVYLLGEEKIGLVYTLYSIDTYETGGEVSEEFKSAAFMAAYGEGSFTADGETYTIADEEGILVVRDASGEPYAELTDFVVSRADGTDNMELELKHALRAEAMRLLEVGETEGSIYFRLPQQTEDGKYEYDENGNLIYVDDSELVVTRKDTGEYEIHCKQIVYKMDTYASPSKTHPLGTDGDGFDVLARVMYGGRISLMVGFIVVILEIFLGVIMGGLSGYFGGWVDNLIMRLVDIFYCLPSMPIMIIIGTMMDAYRMGTYMRLMVMMAALGIMGWAGIARIVRGQILSLREQEFMTAAEATGLKVSRRIFRHLVPNVMPQLIVIATMGLGGVIITESTLSFLGLGVKHPLATWGTMINSVSTLTQLESYVYIWVPVGLLICLTVIAFNFVGDGLRDAFDPKAKR